ncbi:MAG: 2Fe-2S iron-sulfur cluster-binding protein [Tepidisphaeraceae bacterium]
MPKLTIEAVGEFEIPAGKRLIKAILDDAKADQHYSCGGQAKCTSCKVQFISGEPAKITQAEKDLIAIGKFAPQPGERLSCQCVVDGDATIKLLVPRPPTKFPNTPSDEIEPPAVWVDR